MSRFLIAIHRPHGYDASTLSETSAAVDIDDLNDAMVVAGVRVFVGGLQPPSRSTSIRRQPDGTLSESAGHFLNSDEFVDGFWVLEVPSMEEALHWGRKAAQACRASVEVRPFY
jgi:hypothetical protein